MDTATTTLELAEDDDRQVVEFVHHLGCEVVVTAYGHDGERVGIGGAVTIDDTEVEVIVVPGVVRRLVAVPRPPDEDAPTGD